MKHVTYYYNDALNTYFEDDGWTNTTTELTKDQFNDRTKDLFCCYEKFNVWTPNSALTGMPLLKQVYYKRIR